MVEKELSKGENVVIDTCNLYPEHTNLLKSEIILRGLSSRVIFYP